MKNPPYYLLTLLAGLLLACETVIDMDLKTGPVSLSVDGTLTDQPGPQRIRLTQTAAYFNNGPAPAALGATVVVTDDAGHRFAFADSGNTGSYTWTPGPADTLGRVGGTYHLSITYGGDTYVATSTMNRVPPIDSLVFEKKPIADQLGSVSGKEGYQAEFFARDVAGATDYYRVRYYRNGERQTKNRDIITLKDASFPGDDNTDGLVFIRTFRQAINPDSLYAPNDSVRVELMSLTPEAFEFWQQFQQQISNGGLFATPLANVPSNIINTNPAGRAGVGIFTASAIRSRAARVPDEPLR